MGSPHGPGSISHGAPTLELPHLTNGKLGGGYRVIQLGSSCVIAQTRESTIAWTSNTVASGCEYVLPGYKNTYNNVDDVTRPLCEVAAARQDTMILIRCCRSRRGIRAAKQLGVMYGALFLAAHSFPGSYRTSLHREARIGGCVGLRTTLRIVPLV